VGNTGTSPARSYRLINADATYNLTFKATGQTGVTLLPGQSAVVAFNGTDYVIVGTVGAGTATDNAVARFDGTTGEILQNSAATIDDTGAATFVGSVNVSGTSASAADLKLYEDTDNGTNYVAFKSPASVASNVTWTLPSTDGSANQAIVTNGSGTLSFASVTTSPGGSTTQVQYNNAGAFGGSANFVWDNSNVRLGIGTSSPAVPLDVVAQTSASIARFRGRSSDNIATLEWYDNTNATRYTYISSGPSSSSFWNQANTPMAFGTNDTERMRITSGGVVMVGATSAHGSEKVLINGGGTSPTGDGYLTLRRGSDASSGSGVGVIDFADTRTSSIYAKIQAIADATPGTNDFPGALVFYTTADGASSTTERMRIDSSGSVGVGVTPSTWNTVTAVQVKNASFAGYSTTNAYMLQNAYYASGWKYISNGGAARFEINGSSYEWSGAASGTAGNAITFTPFLTIDKDKTLALQGATSATGTGIAFPATQSASSDANTLDDYEEGTFTPTDASGAGLTLTTARGRYTKIGREVTCYIVVTFPSTASGSGVAIGGLPFTSANPYGSGDAGFGGSISYTNTSSTFSSFLAQNSTTATFYTNAGGAVVNSTFSTKETQFILRYFT
jgi:hypothetical protein